MIAAPNESLIYDILCIDHLLDFLHVNDTQMCYDSFVHNMEKKIILWTGILYNIIKSMVLEIQQMSNVVKTVYGVLVMEYEVGTGSSH